MQTFKDDTGQEWTLAINIGSLKRVKALLPDVDLLNIDPKLAARLAVDPFALCDVIFVIVKPQADALEIRDEDFGERMGQTLGEAIKAFWKDLTDFFQKLERRDQAQILTLLQEILREATERNAAAVEQAIPSIKLAASTAGKSPTDSPASSESTPPRSP